MYWPKLAEDAKEMQQACESCSAPITNYAEAFVGETGNVDWREPFIEYLNTGALPQNPSELPRSRDSQRGSRLRTVSCTRKGFLVVGYSVSQPEK